MQPDSGVHRGDERRGSMSQALTSGAFVYFLAHFDLFRGISTYGISVEYRLVVLSVKPSCEN